MNNAIKYGLFNYAWPVAKKLLQWRPGISLSKASAACLSPGDVVLDIGANDGRPALLFSYCIGRTGRVHAVEPNPAMCAKIRQANERSKFKNISAYQLAISSASGEFEFFLDSSPAALAST